MSLAQQFHTPDLTAVLRKHREDIVRSMNCHQVGKIVSFDATKQVANVQLQMKRIIFNTKAESADASTPTEPQVVSYPMLVALPVFVYTGGGSYISMPVAVGDTCLVHFGDRDIDEWFNNGTELEPNTGRAHDLNDGFAVVGYRNLLNKIDGYDTTNVVIRSSSKVDISNGTTSIKAVFDALIDALTAAVDTHGDSFNSSALTALASAKTLSHTLFK